MLLPLLLFLNYHKLHLINMFYHLYWFQNNNWKKHQQLYLFYTVHLLWNHGHQLQLIIKPNCYHWKCLDHAATDLKEKGVINVKRYKSIYTNPNIKNKHGSHIYVWTSQPGQLICHGRPKYGLHS